MKKIILMLIILTSLTGCLLQESYDPVQDVLDEINIVSETANDFDLILVKNNVELVWTSDSDLIKNDGDTAIVTQEAIDNNVELKVKATKKDMVGEKVFNVKVLKNINFPVTTTIANSYSLDDDIYVRYTDVTVQESDNSGTYFTDGINIIYAYISNLEKGDTYDVIGRKITNGIALLDNVSVTQISSTSKYVDPINVSIKDIKQENGYYTTTGVIIKQDDKYFIKDSVSEIELSFNNINLFVNKEVTINVYVNSNSKVVSYASELELNLADSDLLDIVKENLNLLEYTRNDIVLASTSLFNSSITWSSNDSSVLSSEGIVDRQSANTTVTLTATISYKDFKTTKDIDVIVISSDSNYLDELFISEYYEGLSNNKYLEIYNPTELTIDLTDYVLYLGRNGAAFSTSCNLEGVILPGEVYVVYYDACDDSIKSILNDVKCIDSTVAYFNGDDCIGLFKEDILIDLIGIYQQDPGDYWDILTGNTKDHRLIRNKTTGASNVWNVAEWTVSTVTSTNAQVDDLGKHSFV